MKRSVFVVLTSLLLCATALRAQEKEMSTTIILFRHAEKDTMKTDPPLTSRGVARARLMARMLKSAGVRSTHSTQYRRTQATMAPLDSLLGIAGEIIPVNPDSIGVYAEALAQHLLTAHQGETTVVSSHSNVLPLIIQALGVDTVVAIGDGEYDNFFIVTTGCTTRPAFVRLQMGLE